MKHFVATLAFCSLLGSAGAGPSCAQETKPPRVHVSVTADGVRRYEPGQWSVVGVAARNPTSEDSEQLVSVYFGNAAHLQFARQMWVPAESSRRVLLPVRVPRSIPRDRNQLQLTIMQLAGGESGEVLQRREGETLLQQQPLLVDRMTAKTALMFRRPPVDKYGHVRNLDADAYETVYKARLVATTSRAMIFFDGDFVPSAPRALDSLDQVVISGDRILNDVAGLTALRQWLQQGGRVWILLDRTSRETVSALLGNAICCEVIDRVEFNDLTVQDILSPKELSTGEPWESDVPVEMVRVLTESAEVQCEVNGWPAAFWQAVGDGEVLFTTLGPRGWLRSNNNPNAALQALANRFFADRVDTFLPAEEIKPLLTEQIGYRIPSRRLATSILGLNTLGLLVAGLWLARRQQLQRLAWIAPLIAGTATAVFLGLGGMNSTSVPSMAAMGQFVRVAAESNEAHVTGLAAVYSQDTTPLQLEVDGATAVTPEDLDAAGATRRGVWDDNGHCRWENVTMASGSVRFADVRQSLALSQPTHARAAFGPTGLSGSLSGEIFADLADAVIAAPPAPAVAVRVDREGTFSCGVEDVLAPRQYLADRLLSDEQQRRHRIYQRLLNPADEVDYPGAPSLLFWSQPLPLGFQISDQFRQSGSALFSIPLELERTASGAKFQIPSSFIQVESYRGRQGASAVYNPRKNTWMTRVLKPSTTELRFVIPRQVQPCRLERATLTVKINAPSRRLEITGNSGDDVEVIQQRTNPSGVYDFEITRPDVLTLDAGGGLVLGLVVTATLEQLEAAKTGAALGPAKSFDNSSWQIDYVRLEVAGETL